MPEALLELSGVHTHIGRYHILHGVDFTVPAGETTVLLGRNGAGKTTTLRTIMGLCKPSAGHLRFGGREIGGLATADVARAGVAYVPESMDVFAGLTVRENLLLGARESPMDPARLEWLLGLFPALGKFWNHPAGKLSGGQKQMVAIARAIVLPRRLLLVDEPTKGLAPAIVQHLLAAFRELKSAGTTILLVEQNLAFVRSLGDHVAVMDDGRIVHRAAMVDFFADGALHSRLLGLQMEARA